MLLKGTWLAFLCHNTSKTVVEFVRQLVQVKAILADGMITKEKTEALSEVREKLGLNKEQGDKIVRGVQNEALAQSMQSAKAMGELDLQKVLDMKESGVEIESFTSPEFRKSLFQKEVRIGKDWN